MTIHYVARQIALSLENLEQLGFKVSPDADRVEEWLISKLKDKDPAKEDITVELAIITRTDGFSR